MKQGFVLVVMLAASLVRPSGRAAAETPTEKRLRLLEEQLRKTEEQLHRVERKAEEDIRELKGQIQQQKAIGQATQKQAEQAEEEAKTAAATQKGVELPDWVKKVKVGTLFYGDYAFYQKTGFGPQFLTQINPPGPGNDNFSSFDITRAYINLFFTPTDDLTFRVTPNIFRSNGAASAAKTGKSGGINSNLDGQLSYRLKYAYLDFNTPFKRLKEHVPAVEPFSDDKATFGQQQNPLIDWEENLYGYRFVNLVPWNYLSLSSTQAGLALKGPIKFGGLQYVDYDLGIYNNSSFSQREQSETKQGMVRASYYPLGARSRFDGLGITGFYDRGYPNATRDSGRQSHVSRIAALLHYTTDTWGVAAEYDQGHNAFSSKNLFSGSGPADEFGIGKTEFANFDKLAQALQNNGRSTQQGFDFFGHVKIPYTPLTVFGMYEQFFPNTDASTNPFDFRRIVGGIGYQYNKYLRFALSSQNLNYYHGQVRFPIAEAKMFDSKGLKGVKNDIDVAPPDIRAVFLNLEFNY